jgi:hypothetical protein
MTGDSLGTMFRCLLAAVLICAAFPSHAQDWFIREGDHPLYGPALQAAIVNQPVVFFDDGRSRYSAGGSYSYTYLGGQSAYGAFRIADDGQVCITFRNGFDRCDRFVENAGRLVMLTADGQRFPVR